MSTLAQVKTWPIGTVVPDSIKATVKAVFQRKTGESQYGPWSVQTLVVADGGDEMFVSCWGCEELGFLKGQSVDIASTGKDKNGKVCGVETFQGKDKEGHPRLDLKLDHKKGGFVGSGVPNPAYTRPAEAPAPQATPQAAPQAPVPANSSHSARIEGVTVGMAMNCAVRLAVAHGVTDDRVDEYVHRVASSLIRVSQQLQAGDLV